MSKHTRKLDDIVAAHRMRALKKANRHRSDVLYGEVPSCARPIYSTTRYAVFLPCAYRRRGYLLKLNPADLAKLDCRKLKDETRQILEDHWLRGTPWVPPVVHVRWLADRFLVEQNRDYPVALFLAEKKVPLIPIQLLDEGDPPAEECKAASVFRHGLESYTNGIAPIHSAEVVL